MRTTVDIPDETYRELKIKAAREGTPVRQILLRGIQRELENTEEKPVRKLQLPLIRSSRKDKLVIDSEKIYEIIDFP
jgi:plasmid stability protein